MVDYMVLTGGGWPDPATPWALFLAAVRRRGRFAARRRLELMDSVSLAISSQFGGETAGARDELIADAYPLKRTMDSKFWPNVFAADGQEPAHG